MLFVWVFFLHSQMQKKQLGFNTTALQTLQPDGLHAHVNPIYATSTFSFSDADDGMQKFAGEKPGHIYTRWSNPNFAEVEQKIAALEAFGLQTADGQPLELKALLHSSGQAAMSTLFLSTLSQGDAVLSHQSLYGGTHEFLHKILAEAGIEAIIIDMQIPGAVEAALQKHQHIKLIHIETPANPTLQCISLQEIGLLAQQYQVKVSVDNTTCTPYLQQPFAYPGIDFVFHSTTKFLNGHGTAIGGILLGKDTTFMRTKATKWHRLLGGNSNAFDAYLLNQGIKTLGLRMNQHCKNAAVLAQYLHTHPLVEKVNYTGLPSHPQHTLASQQMKQHGALLSFEIKGGLPAGKKFINGLQLCVKAVSFGTLDTLISHPASMSHFGLTQAERDLFHITPGLLRVSVGLEDIEDILTDFEQAFAQV
ncbi:MAG: aminotransferase class I/II-fold pyridoxal phosphate-dependent enzyme [Bacteroidetes bacterium]|nr:MAG: aminotransferase class I/II-fold pyridoxal phosphate-dependent enzyme [Bacteroidota bacterium]